MQFLLSKASTATGDIKCRQIAETKVKRIFMSNLSSLVKSDIVKGIL